MRKNELEFFLQYTLVLYLQYRYKEQRIEEVWKNVCIPCCIYIKMQKVFVTNLYQYKLITCLDIKRIENLLSIFLVQIH